MKRTIMMMLLAAISFSGMAANKKNALKKANEKPETFVLVHGAWQAPWVWKKVKEELKKAGNNVIVVELPGHGTDQTATSAINLNLYRDKVISAIEGTTGRVILVGHSMAGMVISAVAESIPDRIKKLVYIGAYVPADGQSLMDLGSKDAKSLLGPNLRPSEDKLTLDVNKDQLINIFCQDGNDYTKSALMSNYRAEPAIPFGDKVNLSVKNFGKADKYYIYTLQDHAIGIELQQEMANAASITKTFQLNCSHCPFLSMPEKVSSILLEIAK
jgi:pimeloyl-ACP methyl ester carboxylesterase